MYTTMKYSMLRAFRDKELMFSSLLVAILMGTVMYFMADSIMEEVTAGTWEIPVAIVEAPGHEESMFIEILESIEMLNLEFVSMEDALELMESDEIAGIFEVGYLPSLLVPASFFQQRLLQTIADEYVINNAIFANIEAQNPEYLESAMMSLINRDGVMEEMAISENVIDIMQMFMIMFVTTGTLSGVFVGFERAILLNNDAKIGSRRLASSFGKMKLLMADLFGAVMVVVTIAFITWAYFTFVLGVELEVNLALAGLSFVLTGLFGLSFGAFFGLVAPGKRKMREQILNGVYMGMVMIGFFGAQVHNPTLSLINSFNPLMVLVDAIMALNIGSYERYIGFMVTLGVSTIVMLVATIFALRRNRHVDAK